LRNPSGKLTEWDLNETLDAIFMARYLGEYLIVFKVSDLSDLARYEKAQPQAKNRQADRGPLDPQSFRPDLLAIDKHGQTYIFETKVGHGISSIAEHTQLVIQTLFYSNLFISPAWPGEEPWDTYRFLNYLHRAYWHKHRRDYGGFLELQDEHRIFFGLPKSLAQSGFMPMPDVVFLLEHYDKLRLRAACTTIRDMEFADFSDYANKNLPTYSRSRKRLNEMRTNWPRLREIRFHTMPVDLSFLKSVLGQRVPIT